MLCLWCCQAKTKISFLEVAPWQRLGAVTRWNRLHHRGEGHFLLRGEDCGRRTSFPWWYLVTMNDMFNDGWVWEWLIVDDQSGPMLNVDRWWYPSLGVMMPPKMNTEPAQLLEFVCWFWIWTARLRVFRVISSAKLRPIIYMSCIFLLPYCTYNRLTLSGFWNCVLTKSCLRDLASRCF